MEASADGAAVAAAIGALMAVAFFFLLARLPRLHLGVRVGLLIAVYVIGGLATYAITGDLSTLSLTRAVSGFGIVAVIGYGLLSKPRS